ncbi:MAG TPA: glycosyltransferase family 9 protein [Lacipirellulaceae bacterium]|nr:glycosyltransferase family 9 protein [Lacipirellulaceae bacterium]
MKTAMRRGMDESEGERAARCDSAIIVGEPPRGNLAGISYRPGEVFAPGRGDSTLSAPPRRDTVPPSPDARLVEAAAAMPAARPPRFLIVRLSALGDVIHGLPVACALRAAHPEATIGWVAEGRNADLLAGHPAIDDVIAAPRRWLKSPRAIMDLRRRLRTFEFDVALDLQCLTKSAVAAWLSGAPRRIGKAGVHGRELSRWIHNELVAVGGRHVVDHCLEMLSAVDVTAAEVRFDLPERMADARTVDDWLRGAGLLRRQFVVLNAGAGWPAKVWPCEHYAELAQRLRAEHGLASVAAWGNAAERTLAEAIVAAADGAARLAPPPTVAELAALSRRAAAFVGSDTGPMHLAVAVGTPTVSLHGPTVAEWCGAYGPTNARLQSPLDDGSSSFRRTAGDEAMRAISVDAVAAACDALLARPYERRAG